MALLDDEITDFHIAVPLTISRSSSELTEPIVSDWNFHNVLNAPKTDTSLRRPVSFTHYSDINKKEWIIVLVNPKVSIFKFSNACNSFLYDIENDKYIPFIENYERDINKKFNISHNADEMTFAIDNDNYLLYWFNSLHMAEQEEEEDDSPKLSSLLVIDIKDLQNIKLIKQYILPRCTEIAREVVVVGNTLHLVAGHPNSMQHYQFVIFDNKKDSNNNNNNDDNDSKNSNINNYKYDGELELVHDNIHSICMNRISEANFNDWFENLKINDLIDSRDGWGKFHLAIITDIGDIKRRDSDNCIISMTLSVHYAGWPTKWDETFRVTIEKDTLENGRCSVQASSICDCTTGCYLLDDKTRESYGIMPETYWKKGDFMYHRITLPRTQSIRSKSLTGCQAIYSKIQQKMLILGPNNVYLRTERWSGIYSKRINDKHLQIANNKDNTINGKVEEEEYFELIVNGFIHEFEQKKVKHDDYKDNIFIPKDICNLVLKYYYIPSDKEWQLIERHERFDRIHHQSARVLVNNDNDIFFFGGQDMNPNNLYGSTKMQNIIFRFNFNTNEFRQLTNIKFPPQFDTIFESHGTVTLCNLHAVFCKQTQSIHLLETVQGIHCSIQLSLLNQAQSLLLDSPQ